MRLTRNHAVHFSNKAATRFTRNLVATIKNSEHAQSVEVIVGVVIGQKVVRPKPDRQYRLLRLCKQRELNSNLVGQVPADILNHVSGVRRQNYGELKTPEALLTNFSL